MEICKKELEKYSAPYRLWQGIPGIEVTPKGRVFIALYSGGTKEEIGNFVFLLQSSDGVTFSEPIVVAYQEGHRCFDPCLWIDPMGRLWFFWSRYPDNGVFGVYCENPDADELVWSKVFEIGKNVMMNKPTVLKTGEWLLPITVWNLRGEDKSKMHPDKKAFVYRTTDGGKSFCRLGGVDMENRSYDEHMILELSDGRLAMYVRTTYGIGVAYSYDKGLTWTEGEDSGLGGPCSRFFISRLKSGRILLINHYNFEGRNNLTAMLSEDDGKTFPYKLLLDERDNVSYPDAVERNGYIYIAYDRERGCFKNSLEEVYDSAREILVAKITEQDILNGQVENEGSYLKRVVSKLGEYALENPFLAK